MKSRLHKIEIRNFKAFREFTLNLEGRHLLVYGDNGAGKSSLYWALYTFLQSARKPKNSIGKYFDPADPQNLLNIHEKDPAAKPGEIALTLRDVATKNDTTYRISQTNHDTHDEPMIVKGDRASDFVTYRFFFGFSDFKNTDDFDIWPLFERDILPFCVGTGAAAGELEDRWNILKNASPNPNKYRGKAGAKAFRAFNESLKDYTNSLKPIVDDISAAAQNFYDTHFAREDFTKITLRLAVTRDAYYSKMYTVKVPPALRFGIQSDGIEVKKPQSFMNEAKMTQLALSVRFAASLVNLNDSDVKLLVLDDLLVSLDMSNRMRVVEILLSETFDDYQKIILTHDMGLFREFRRALGNNHADWQCVRLEGKPSDPSVSCKNEKTYTQKAEEFLHGHNLDEAALCLRKACEDTAKRFIDHDEALPTKDYLKLSEALRAARSKIHSSLNVELYEKIVRFTPEAHRRFLIASCDSDIEAESALSEAERGRLKGSRKNLRKMVSADHVEKLRKIKLIDDILACTERVLNPAAHSGTPPLYQKEVQDALDLVRQLETALSS